MLFFMGAGLGYREYEFGAQPWRTFCPDSSAVLFHDSFCDRQTESGSHVRRGFCLPEEIEDLTQMLLFDSGSRVFHLESHAISIWLACHGYASAFRREFDRIVQEIGKHLK